MPRYRAIRVPADHPLAIRNASFLESAGTVQIWEHRKVLFDKIGFGPHQCHWCSRSVNWTPGKAGGGGATLVVDHLDNDRRHNVPSNLVPSCQSCNAHRAGAHPFERVGDDEPHVIQNGKRVRATERICLTCGIAFLIPNAYARRPTAGRYCSMRCMYNRSQT